MDEESVPGVLGLCGAESIHKTSRLGSARCAQRISAAVS